MAAQKKDVKRAERIPSTALWRYGAAAQKDGDCEILEWSFEDRKKTMESEDLERGSRKKRRT